MTSDGPSRSTKARARISIAILLLSVATLTAMDRYGKSRRIFADRRLELEVAGPDQAYEAWKKAGLHGRTLLLFGPFPHLWRSAADDVGPHPRGPDSFLDRAALDNIVRRVYVFVRDDEWDAAFGVQLPGFFRKAPSLERGFYLHYPIGLPVIATTPASLPSIEEPCLVYVDKKRFALPLVEEVLSRKGIVSDLIVASSGI